MEDNSHRSGYTAVFLFNTEEGMPPAIKQTQFLGSLCISVAEIKEGLFIVIFTTGLLNGKEKYQLCFYRTVFTVLDINTVVAVRPSLFGCRGVRILVCHRPSLFYIYLANLMSFPSNCQNRKNLALRPKSYSQTPPVHSAFQYVPLPSLSFTKSQEEIFLFKEMQMRKDSFRKHRIYLQLLGECEFQLDMDIYIRNGSFYYQEIIYFLMFPEVQI